ncbi:carbon storage regulator CsrA [Viridibacillus arvi]|uniref:carbon storage regulator CsrA n=1 Tax=Viridibacillus arvi TaxID=263475 RepID=UPI003D053E87
MLVLSRKTDESIMIGDNVEIKILSVDGEQVKIGIVAPKTVKIHRSEVFAAIQEQNKEALNVSKSLIEQISRKKL